MSNQATLYLSLHRPYPVSACTINFDLNIKITFLLRPKARPPFLGEGGGEGQEKGRRRGRRAGEGQEEGEKGGH